MKKNFKIAFIILVLINIIMLFQTVSLATTNTYDYDFSEAEKWSSRGTIAEKTQNTVGAIITVVRVVGTGIAIIMLLFIAIKYMMAAPSEKANFKQSATAYIVGAVVLFATTNILQIISNFATTNTQ